MRHVDRQQLCGAAGLCTDAGRRPGGREYKEPRRRCAFRIHARRCIFDVMGEVTFGTRGEWTRPRVLQVQFQGITGHDLDRFRDGSRQVVVAPQEVASGSLIYPFAKARIP